MSPLLSIEGVSKGYPDGKDRHVVLDGVSVDIRPGAQIGVYGPARSGKSTLLRIAVGIEAPDTGTVRFEGRDLTRMRPGARARLLRRAVGYISSDDWRPNQGESVQEHIAMTLGSDGFTPREAARAARRALERAGLDAGCAHAAIRSLSVADRAGVALARALVREPRLLVVDEPATMPSLSDRDRFCALLRGVARERGIALLVASVEMAALQGLDVLMSLSGGELCSMRGAPRPESLVEQATVVALPTWRIPTSARRPAS